MAIEVVGTSRRRASRDARHRQPVAASAGEGGQASVSLVAVIPLLLLLAAGGIQAALAGHALVAATHAAQAAARAEYTGEAVKPAARAALPAAMRDRMDVTSSGEGVRVELTAARLLPFGPRIPVEASAKVGPAGG